MLIKYKVTFLIIIILITLSFFSLLLPLISLLLRVLHSLIHFFILLSITPRYQVFYLFNQEKNLWFLLNDWLKQWLLIFTNQYLNLTYLRERSQILCWLNTSLYQRYFVSLGDVKLLHIYQWRFELWIEEKIPLEINCCV